MKRLFALMFGLVMAVLLAVSAYAEVPVTVDSVEVDGFALSAGTTTVRQLERGESFDVKVKLTATADTSNVQINAFISGYEHSSSGSIDDSTRPFDLADDESVVKTLKLSLPERADRDRYLLRIVISDRSNTAVIREYGIKVEPSDTQVVITHFGISPENAVGAGRAVLATVRVKNLGDSTEDDVEVRVSIPGLGVSSIADFIDELEEGESATSEEFFLKTDACAKPGTYDVVAEVTFDEGDEKVTAKLPLTVTEAGVCPLNGDGKGTPSEGKGKVTIAYSSEAQSVVAGGAASAYPVTITNSGSADRVFTLSVDNAQWADFRVSPSGMVTVPKDSTQTAFVFVSAKADAQPGEHIFTVSVKDTAGNVLQNLAMRTAVTAAPAAINGGGNGLPNLRDALTAGLVVIVAILVVVGLVLAFRRTRGGEEGESQTYY